LDVLYRDHVHDHADHVRHAHGFGHVLYHVL
jgi:hypothetical protein